MNVDQVYAFLQLGLRLGADEQEIKRAYAQKIKNCNPETDAENWMQLHNAYKLALTTLQENDDAQHPGESVDLPPIEPPPQPVDDSGDEGSEFNGLFDNLENLAHNAAILEEQRQREYKAATDATKRAQIGEARKRLKQRIRKLCRRAWWKKLDGEDLKSLFLSPDFRSVSGEYWSIALLYPLLQSSVYTKRLTPEAKNALSLQIFELYRMKHPDFPNIPALMSKIVSDTRAQAEKRFKKQGRPWGWIVFIILLVLAKFPNLILDPFASDNKYIEYVYNTRMPESSLTVHECIGIFTQSPVTYCLKGDTVVVSSGSGDRSVTAVFTLKKKLSNTTFPWSLCGANRRSSKPVYVLSFQIGSYECRGYDDLEDFGSDISMQKRGLGYVNVPWKPGSGDAARELIRGTLTTDKTS